MICPEKTTIQTAKKTAIGTKTAIKVAMEMATKSGRYNTGVKADPSIPCIGAVFSNKNFYSRQEGQLNLEDVDSIADQGRSVIERIDRMEERIDAPQLKQARRQAELAASIDSRENCDLEDVQKADQELLHAKQLIHEARQEHLKVIRQMDLDHCVEFFDDAVRQYANPAEQQAFDALTKTAQKSIDRNDSDFDNILSNLRMINTNVLVRQDWFIVDWYRDATSNSANYLDKSRFHELKRLGDQGAVTVPALFCVHKHFYIWLIRCML